MNVLVACEESQTVCKAFRDKGHRAFSCDILACSGGFPEWHILGDALSFINGNCDFFTQDGLHHFQSNKWDLLISHPPCTYLSNAGARHLYKGGILNEERLKKGLDAANFFLRFLYADCDMVCVENPVPSKVFCLPAASQIIQPFMFGHPFTKRTCLWLRGLPMLSPTNIVSPVASWCPSGSYSHHHCDKYRGMFTTDRARNRAKTFSGIALAMAEQWG